MRRSIWSPHVCTSAALKRSWLNGMRSSATHPLSLTVVAADHTGSQLASTSPPRSVTTALVLLTVRPELVNTSSRRTPAGFTLKRNADRWSW